MSEETITIIPKKKKRVASKAKGNANELKLSKLLAEHLAPLKFVRTQQSGAITGGKNFGFRGHMFSKQTLEHYVGDVVPSNEEEAGVKFRFVIETKAYKTPDSFESLFTGKHSVYGWLDEVDVDKVKVDKEGIVIMKWNNTPYYASVRPHIELPCKHMTLPSGDKVCHLSELLKHTNFWFV